MRPTLYIAGEMFCGAKRDYNQLLTHKLEELGYKVVLPQRDGFDFAWLHRELLGYLPEYMALPAAHLFIYLLDLGIFVESSDVITANCDEPIDPGMLCEMMYAREIQNKVIAVRTDLRSPFGGYMEILGGMHSFVWFSATDWLRIHDTNGSSISDVPFHERVAQRINIVLHGHKHDSSRHRIARGAFSRDIRKRAEYLFDGVNRYKDNKTIQILVERYQKRFEWLKKIQPHEA